MNYISQNIRAIRKHHNLTQEEFASKIDNKRDNIASWELGKALPSVNVLQLIGDIFHISLNDLITTDMGPRLAENKMEESQTQIYYNANSKSASELVKFLQEELRIKNEVIKSLLQVINKKIPK